MASRTRVAKTVLAVSAAALTLVLLNQCSQGPQFAFPESGGAYERGRALAVPTDTTEVAILMPSLQDEGTAREQYQEVPVNPFLAVAEQPVSTFSIDVDSASYANVRRFLNDGVLPPAGAVRVEELVNYFDYDYARPNGAERPFRADVAVFDSPWNADRQIVRIGLQGRDLARTARPRANLVFLVDTSGSMEDRDKLPLVQRSLRLLVDELEPDDSIAIVAYAGFAGVVLEPTPVAERGAILRAIGRLDSGGGTAGAEGLRTAYELAEQELDPAAINRVILATDGDFNIGISDPERLSEFVARKRETGIYLSVLGFGRGNLNDFMMQRLAQTGNGNAAYIDSLMEARRVLVDQLAATLFPIADDVKVQIEFNPALVAEYRLIGYETRRLARQDFANDRVDAGEVGSGHAVTALYEITAPDSAARLLEDLRYGTRVEPAGGAAHRGELAFLRLRYKLPGEAESRLMEQPIPAAGVTGFAEAPANARFAVAVAGFGQRLRRDPNIGDFGWDEVMRIARDARGKDDDGYQAEFLRLVQMAESAAALETLN
ncbi:MAG: VWA domain-containing protein [Inquilinus sp.]|nr:VWA domain-containing protein [Inquilinus sp.]